MKKRSVLFIILGLVGFILFSFYYFLPQWWLPKNVSISSSVGSRVSEDEIGLPNVGEDDLVVEKEVVPVEENISSSENEKENKEKEVLDEKPGDNLPKKEIVKSPTVIKKLVSFGYQKSLTREIDTIVIHSSYNALGGDYYDVDKIIAEYKEYEVAPHYLIDRNGKIYQLVEDKNTAYHAGESKVPDGRKGVNGFSIGIEMINTKTDEYTDKQYSSLRSFLVYLKSKYEIKYILGHKDISPGRKDDPWRFKWEKVK